MPKYSQSIKNIFETIIKIPVWIKELTELNKTDKQVYSQLVYFTQTTGKTEHRAKNQYLADLVGISTKQVSRIIKKLELLGLITVEIFDRFDRVITIIKDKMKMSNPPDKETKGNDNLSNSTPQKAWWQKKNQGNYKENIKKHNLSMFQRDTETLEDFEIRCSEREALGDVKIEKHYAKTNDSSKTNCIDRIRQAYLNQKNKLLCSNYQTF
jgi:DNA-binding MarR family transcriptional regulator